MQKAREPWAAQTAYLKDVALYFLPLATVYVLLPFHFVLAVQREVRSNQHTGVLALLSIGARINSHWTELWCSSTLGGLCAG